jgi:hypothetical protein
MVALALSIGVSAAAVVAPLTSGATTTPPWEPDAQSVGGLLFYNASGVAITGGNVTDSPLAAYVQGETIVRTGDTKATLYGYLPVDGQLPAAWSGEQLRASTAYPNASAPAPLNVSTLPVETGSGTDETVAQLASDFPNNDSSSDGYAGMYQLRLYTSAPQESVSTTYDSADIEITGSTWSVVYSQSPQVATTTSLAVAPAAAVNYGATVKLTATVTPSDAVGSVQFLDGTKLLGSIAVSSGSATYSTTKLLDATHSLKATFVPTNSANFAGSTSSVKTLKVSAKVTTTALKASKTSLLVKQTLTLTATEAPAASGSITFYDGAKKLVVVKVAKGAAHYSTNKLAVGVHSLKATFTPSSASADKASTSKVVKVTIKK